MNRGRVFLTIGIALVLLLAFGAWFDKAAVGRGLVYALVAGSAAPAGAAALLLIGDLTGGRWILVARRGLVPMAASLPGFAVLFLLIALDLPAVYGWTTDDGVRRAYLNAPAFIIRGVVIFLVWSMLAWRATRGPGRPLTAGLALVAYAVTVTIAATDWAMSLTPHWSSTAYGASFAISQIAAALAALLVFDASLDAPARDDIAKLALATMLGLVYLVFMQLLVIWSGNLPDRIDYYVTRRLSGWSDVETAALMIGGLVPFVLLLARRGRRSVAATRVAGIALLLGLGLHFAWEILAGQPPSSLAAGGVALLATLLVLLAWMGRTPAMTRAVVRHG